MHLFYKILRISPPEVLLDLDRMALSHVHSKNGEGLQSWGDLERLISLSTRVIWKQNEVERYLFSSVFTSFAAYFLTLIFFWMVALTYYGQGFVEAFASTWWILWGRWTVVATLVTAWPLLNYWHYAGEMSRRALVYRESRNCPEPPGYKAIENIRTGGLVIYIVAAVILLSDSQPPGWYGRHFHFFWFLVGGISTAFAMIFCAGFVESALNAKASVHRIALTGSISANKGARPNLYFDELAGARFRKAGTIKSPFS